LLASLPERQRRKILAGLTKEERQRVEFLWPFWARPKQLPPPGTWRTWLILAGRAFGKALAIDTPIPTPDGWKTMGELREGDLVFDENGHPTRVTFATGVMEGRPCFDVVFSDGTVITADGDHQWLTTTHAARKAKSRCRKAADGSANGASSPPSSRRKRSGGRSTLRAGTGK
jgi:hypothetical protein